MKKILSLCCVVLLLVILAAGCGKEQPPAQDNVLLQLRGPQAGDTIVTFETSKGTFKAVLYEDQAPLAVQNFVELASRGYYDGLIFHRVVADFVIQTGDPTGTGMGGESASGQPFKNEYGDLHHFTGALGMANSGTDLNMSQFYVVQGAPVSQNLVSQMQQNGFDQQVIEAYQELGGTPTLDNRYTVFGQVYAGLDVVAAISKIKTDTSDRPLKDITLIKVTIETCTEQMADAADGPTLD